MGSLRVKLWGTRGLISSPRPETAIFGGNTPCLQLLYGNHLILVDTGFGVSNFGDELMQRIIHGKERLTIHIFYTHFHWDHIQGLPFFKPIYFPSTTMHIYSPEKTATTLENLNILFDGSYSPFESLMSMQAQIRIHQIQGPQCIDGLTIDHQPVDHGDHFGKQGGSVNEDTYAFRFVAPDESKVCLVTDHEARPSPINDAVVKFAQGADLLIHDGQYLDDDYARYRGFGHSSATMALDNAIAMGARATLLTHHDPSRNDKDLQALHRSLMRVAKYRHLNFEFAREEIVYEALRTQNVPKAS